MKTYNPKIKENITSLGFDLCSEMLKSEVLPVFMCVGTSKVISDSIGPLVGHLLVEKYNINTFVYGNLKNNITSENVSFYHDFVTRTHKHAKVFVIDSALGELCNLGLVKFNKGGVYVGGQFSENSQLIGDYNMLGIVNTTGINSLLFLKSTKLQSCLELAHYIAASIHYAFLLYNKLNCISPQKNLTIKPVFSAVAKTI